MAVLAACGPTVPAPGERHAPSDDEARSERAHDEASTEQLAPISARNVVLVVVDSLRADMLNPATMPEVSRWAAEGVAFDGRSPSFWAKASVATLLTAVEPARHGADASDAMLSGELVTLADVLHCHGYSTALFAANGYISDRFGFARPFDHYTNYIRESLPSTADRVTGDALRWIESQGGRRFFVYLHLIDPHVPYDPPPSHRPSLPPNPDPSPRRTAAFVDRAQRGEVTPSEAQRDQLRALYQGEVRFVDEVLGDFFAELERLGRARDTLIVLTSSNGEALGESGVYGHPALSEVTTAVPLVFRGPGSPARDDAPVDLIRVAPTVVAALGFDRPAAFEASGIGSPPLGPPTTPPYTTLRPAMDRALCEQLRALGYVGSDLRCEDLPGPEGPVSPRVGPCETTRGGVFDLVRADE